jgi:hypothetical protein
MRRLGALSLVAVVGLGGVGEAASAPNVKQTIKLLARTAPGSVRLLTDKPPQGKPSVGDVVVGSDNLRNAVAQFGEPKGALVGRDRWRFVLTSKTLAVASVTASLPGGSISCRGLSDEKSKVDVLRVTGATGVFKGATGTCESSQGPGDQSLNTYRLTLP